MFNILLGTPPLRHPADPKRKIESSTPARQFFVFAEGIQVLPRLIRVLARLLAPIHCLTEVRGDLSQPCPQALFLASRPARPRTLVGSPGADNLNSTQNVLLGLHDEAYQPMQGPHRS